MAENLTQHALEHTTAPTPTNLLPGSEEELIQKARQALSACNWVIGECATQWTQKYAKGRTDADFGNLVGLSGDQVYQRRRVWEKFHDVYQEYSALSWSHFYISINWDDAAECLQWAQEQQASVAEMKAWRRAIHGEDLKTPGNEAELSALGLMEIGGQYSEVKDTLAPPFEPNQDVSTQPWDRDEWGMSSMSGTEMNPAMAGMPQRIGQDGAYSPYSSEARGSAPSERNEQTAKAVSPAELLEKSVKRCVWQINKAANMIEAHPELTARLPEDLLEEFTDAVDRLSKLSHTIA